MEMYMVEYMGNLIIVICYPSYLIKFLQQYTNNGFGRFIEFEAKISILNENTNDQQKT